MKYLLVVALSILAAISANALTVDTLRCDYRDTPVGIDSSQPLLSWLPESQTRGDTVTAYEVQVASSAAALASGGNLWDSGKVATNQNAHIPYGGAALSSFQQVFWHVRLWDGNGVATAWSAPASWTMGVLNPADWSGSWIMATRASNGYHAVPSATGTGNTWVQVDLGSAQPITSVRLDPANYLANTPLTGTTAYGFPTQFAIQASNDPTFTTGAATIFTTGATNYPNPGLAVASFPASVTARYVRVTATAFYYCPGNSIADPIGGNYNYYGESYVFSLSQLEVISGGANVAVGANVSTSDGGVQENSTWSNTGLTDGIGYVGFPGVTQSDRFRTTFSVGSGLKRAVVNICGLGNYQMTVNGTNVTTDLLTPNWSMFNKTCFYNSYDITALLQAGNNAAGITLGNGMYNVTGGRYTRFFGSFGPRQVIAQIRLEYNDGTVSTIGTNPSSWQWSPGPMTFCCIYGGEDRDARLDPSGWDTTAYNSSGWYTPVATAAPSGAVMRGDSLDGPPVQVTQTFTPVNSWVISPGVTVYDFGQNAASIPTITVSGSAGASVVLTPAELINGDGTLNQQYAPVYMTYTLSGSGTETFTPTFFYFGCRYIQVELRNANGSTTATPGVPVPVLKSITNSAVSSSAQTTGSFSSSNTLFNQIYSLIGWAQYSNMMACLTDCPQREKFGWLEEDHLNGPGLRYVHGMSALFTKISQDIVDSQASDGLVYTVAPRYIAESPPSPIEFDTSPEWGSTLIIGAWQQYQFEGDTALLARNYASMSAYVDYLTSTATNYILPGGLGDWVNLDNGETPANLTSTAIYYQDAITLSNIASVLGNTTDAATYSQLAANIASAFNATFYNSAAGYYSTDTETSNAMPLDLGIVPAANQSTVLNALVANLASLNYGFTCGEIGHPYVLDALANNGRSDVVFNMHDRTSYPGYGYILSLGATSLTEAWDGDGSQDHLMLGHLMNWFYKDLAGIQPDPAGPGFKKIIIKPAMVGDISWNNASYVSVSGTVVSNWTHGANGLTMNVTIPPGSTASVYVPAANPSLVQESGVPAASAPDVTYTGTAPGAAVYSVGSGSYSFSSIDTAQAPTGLTSEGSSEDVTLSWGASINASSYTIQRSTVSGSGFVTIASGVTGLTYSDTNVVNGTTYYYLVTGSNAAGAGASAATSTTPQIIADAGFEFPVVSGYAYDPTGSPWTFSGASPSGSGITANYSAFTYGNGAPAPEGVQAAFIQQTGSFSQVVNGLTPGSTYSLTFSAAQREGDLQTWNVTMNGATIGSYNPSTSVSTYTPYTATFTAVARSETLAFLGTDINGGDNTVFIDNLQITNTGSGTATSGSGSPLASGTTPAAVFVKADSATQGSWKGVYGSDGFNTIDDTVQYPSYVTVTASGAATYTWQSSTSDIRALQQAASTTNRIAACMYTPANQSSYTIDMNITDGNAHQFAIYALDWDGYGPRSETIQIVDPVAGTVLDTESLNSFQQGEYLVWTVQGHVRVRVANNNPSSNAVLSGLFFDPVQSGTTGGGTTTSGSNGTTTSGSNGTTTSGTTPAATFVKTDSATQGTWKGVYGSDGFDTIEDTVQYPAYVTVTNGGGASYAWQTSTSDVRALQQAASATNRIAACLYTPANQSSYTIDLNITDGNAHNLAIYALDWDGFGPRSETIQIVNSVTGTVLDTESVTSFQGGKYLIWTIQGHVQVRVTNNNPSSNAVISGLFFDPSQSGTTGGTSTSGSNGTTTSGSSAALATFVKSDNATQGSWKGAYGSDGFNTIEDTVQYPAYVTVSNGAGLSYAWQSYTTDIRALQQANSTTNRIAACLYTPANQSSYNLDMNITDGKAHNLAIYALDWDGYGPRSETIQILDAVAGTVLDTESLTSFQQGRYLVWTIQGHVQVRVTNNNPSSNAVISGLFFDPPPTSGTASERLQVSSTAAFISSGTMGGAFTPGSDTYALSNSGTSSITWSASATQSWLSLSTSGGTLSGSGSSTVTASINANANALASGTYTDTITFTDLGTAATQTEPVSLIVAPLPPAITSPLTATVASGAAFSYQIAASHNPTKYGAAGLPSGLGVNSATGLITGNTSASGTSSVTLSAANASGTGTATLVLTVLPPPPVIASGLTATATAGVAFSYQIAATNNPTSFGATGLPSGLSVNSVGLISGTATATGTSDITLAAGNAGGSGTATLVLTVLPPPPVVDSSLTATATTGVAFSYQIAATSNPTSFGATGLPAGLSVNSVGLISGTATATGISDITLAAGNAGGSGYATLVLTVLPPPPAVDSSLTATATSGVAFSYQIAATNNPTSFGATGLPSGLSINSLGLIGGTATATGTSDITLTAGNAGGSGTATLVLTVLPPPPVITSQLTANATTGVGFNYQITASNSPTSFSASGLPPGLSVNSLGLISGTATATGTSAVTITASNAGGSGAATLSLTVLAPNAPIETLYIAYSNGDGYVEEYSSSGPSGVNRDLGPMPGSTTQLWTPNGIAFDSKGNLYVANDSGPGNTCTVSKFGPDGTYLGAFASGFVQPCGIAFDSADNLYVADGGNSTIVKITQSGSSSVFASTGLNIPQGIAFGPDGNLYVADLGSNSIKKITPAGVLSTFFSDASYTILSQVEGVAVDTATNVYVSSNRLNTIEKISQAGVATLFASNPSPASDPNDPDNPSNPEGLFNPIGLTFDKSGDLFVANFHHTQIVGLPYEGHGITYIDEFSPNGTLINAFSNNPSLPGEDPNLRDGNFIAIKYSPGPDASEALQVSATSAFIATAPQGGPFPGVNDSYGLSNASASSLNWGASVTTGWLSLSATGGTLGAGSSVTVTAYVNSTASTLAPGTYTDTVTFTDYNTGYELSEPVNFSISATPYPVITSSPATTATTGSAFSYSITATNSPSSFNATGLPSGLSVNTSTGLISGTAIFTGTSTVTLTAANASGTGSASMVLSVIASPSTTGTGNSAVFVKTDTTTQGNWKGVYGSDGFNTINDTVQYPAYVTVTPSGAASYTWQSSTSDVRALEQAASSTNRIAACLYTPGPGSSYTIDLNITDGKTHNLAIYALDWDDFGPRAETIQIINPVAGTVLDTESLTSFQQGKYLVWTIQGHVQVIVTNNNPASNAVISGLFFDP